MAHCLQLWKTHSLLCGELILKLTCFTEASASLSNTSPEEVAVQYDRATLLKTLTHLNKGIGWIQLARADSKANGGQLDERSKELSLLHGELCYVLTRMKVKLAATIPPPGQSTLRDMHYMSCVFRYHVHVRPQLLQKQPSSLPL